MKVIKCEHCGDYNLTIEDLTEDINRIIQMNKLAHPDYDKEYEEEVE